MYKGNAVTEAQMERIIYGLMNDTNWRELSSERARSIVDLPREEFAARFLAWLQNNALEVPAPAEAQEKFSMWRTFRIGGLDKKSLWRRVRGFSIDTLTKSVIKNPAFTMSDIEEEIDTIILQVKDLGYDKAAPPAQLLDPVRLAEWSVQNQHRLPEGYDAIELLPAEAALYIRYQYKDQWVDEGLNIAMVPIKDYEGYLNVFLLYDPFYISLKRAHPRITVWDIHLLVVFRLRKKASEA